MVILIDSREQRPLEFNHPYVTSIERIKLNVADYGVRFIDGFIPPVFFERKTIADLTGTLGKGYKRFKKEIERAKEADVSMFIAIEGCYSKVLKGHSHSSIEGITVIRHLMTLDIKHNVWHRFFRDRSEMAHYITEYFVAVGKEYMRRKKELKRSLTNGIMSSWLEHTNLLSNKT